MKLNDMKLVRPLIKKGYGKVVFSLDGEFVYKNFEEIIKAISDSIMTDDQKGDLIDYLRDVNNSYIAMLEEENVL